MPSHQIGCNRGPAKLMGKFYRLDHRQHPARRSQSDIAFNRTELNLLLSLYSRRVMSGEWRDYAIDQRSGAAVFSIYRHSQDRPLFTIAKHTAGPERSSEFLVCRGAEKLARTPSLPEALGVFRSHLRVVS